MKKWSLIALVAIALTSCSTYQNALKVEDIAYKNEVADQLYNEGSYKKAINLYEQILEKEKWNQNFQSTYYNYGKAMYVTEKYELSGAFFRAYNQNYVDSPFREETMFLEAMSEYHLTDVFSKDQQRTYHAIQKFDQYFAQFPQGEFRDEAILKYQELKGKIEKKAYENAYLYNKIGEYTRDYNAAMVALDNFMMDYPGSVYKEDALFYKFDSAYKLAINSVYNKMQERLEKAIIAYDALVAFNENTKYKKDADVMLARIQKELQQFSK
ncbi:MAG TPA: outer membrane protein assembly factor BamD [Flavobacterium sp.]|nr:outer membrane protein assembly factor BamD [Flavobacterium sp.]